MISNKTEAKKDIIKDYLHLCEQKILSKNFHPEWFVNHGVWKQFKKELDDILKTPK